MPSSTPRPRWEALRRNFTESNYITDFWNWFMTLMSKAAEMVLFGTVLYSGYQPLPGVPHVPPAIDAAVFVVQQGALDIGGMGLLKLAKRAGLPKDSFPIRLGISLVVLMILNVALASIKHTLPMIPDGVFVGIETLLLMARAVVAVLFGHAIHALRDEYGESTVTVKEANELQQHIDELSSELSYVQQHLHQQLSSELADMRESLQRHQDRLASIPAMQAHLQHLESSIRAGTCQQTERPVLRVLPPVQQQHYGQHERDQKRTVNRTHGASPQATRAAKKFDARAFVFTCLRENSALKLAEIEQLALAQRQELSQATASRYRKQFFARHESVTVTDDESSSIDERNIVGK